MSAEREVIDLDEHNHRSTAAGSVVSDRLLTRRKVSVRLVAAFVVGGILGGFGVSELRDSREERERNASVALVAFPASIAGVGSDVPGVLQLDGHLRRPADGIEGPSWRDSLESRPTRPAPYNAA
ncbi:hypothetical protein ABZ356_10370 [Micromonospora zamorensis]|uniref:hypothetical protein n=1 Tax=Micromonospora zamorensis TaxID=709883 RepID=UPI0033B59D99